MNFWTVTLVSLALGILLVMGGAIVIYMGSLVKNAYQLKIEIQDDLKNGLQRVEEESEKKSRWLKREIVEEVEKIRTALAADTQKKLSEAADSLSHRLDEMEQALKGDRTDADKAFVALRRDVTALEQKFKSLRRDQQLAASAAVGGGAPSSGQAAPQEDTSPPAQSTP